VASPVMPVGVVCPYPKGVDRKTTKDRAAKAVRKRNEMRVIMVVLLFVCV
jgi:hypothetical protein